MIKRLSFSLTPRTVDRYGYLCAEIKTREEEKELLRDNILQCRALGKTIPEGNDYILLIKEASSSKVNWKEVAMKYAEATYGKELGEKKIMEEEASAEVKTHYRITPVPRAKK